MILISFRVFGRTRELVSRLSFRNSAPKPCYRTGLTRKSPSVPWLPACHFFTKNSVLLSAQKALLQQGLVAPHHCHLGDRHLEEQWSPLGTPPAHRAYAPEQVDSVHCMQEWRTLWLELTCFSRTRAKYKLPIESHLQKWKQIKS